MTTCTLECWSWRQEGMDIIVSMSSTILGFPVGFPFDKSSASANSAWPTIFLILVIRQLATP